MQKPLIRVFAKLVLAAFITHAASMYFRLGWFLPIVWSFGAVLAVVFTSAEWKLAKRSSLFAGLTAFAYLFITIGSLNLLTNRKQFRTFTMNWTDKGRKNDLKESEVVLRFVDYPQFFIGIYSNELAEYLKKRGQERISTEFVVTSDFGCMRGFHETKIEDLSTWRSLRGYSGVQGNARDYDSPWGKDRWWCP